MTDVQQVILRIRFLAEKRGISINQLLRECKLNKSVLDNMKRGSMPSADKLAAIADYFNCSVDYILGRVDKPGIGKAFKSGGSRVNSYSNFCNTQEEIQGLTTDEILQIRELLHKE